jgi:Mor family transcriptional regulator
MARPKVAAYVERNAEIARRYRRGDTVRALGAEYGIDKSRIRKILGTFQIPIRPEPRLCPTEKAPIDDLSLLIGIRLKGFQLQNGLSRIDLATKLKLSEQKILDAIRGTHDWRYTELINAASGMGLSVAELTAPPKGLPALQAEAARTGCQHTPSSAAPKDDDYVISSSHKWTV